MSIFVLYLCLDWCWRFDLRKGLHVWEELWKLHSVWLSRCEPVQLTGLQNPLNSYHPVFHSNCKVTSAFGILRGLPDGRGKPLCWLSVGDLVFGQNFEEFYTVRRLWKVYWCILNDSLITCLCDPRQLADVKIHINQFFLGLSAKWY